MSNQILIEKKGVLHHLTDTKNRLKYSFQSVFNAVPVLHFRDDKVSIEKICLVTIMISQLKCALHILIGDWYECFFFVAIFPTADRSASIGALKQVMRRIFG